MMAEEEGGGRDKDRGCSFWWSWMKECSSQQAPSLAGHEERLWDVQSFEIRGEAMNNNKKSEHVREMSWLPMSGIPI